MTRKQDIQIGQELVQTVVFVGKYKPNKITKTQKQINVAVHSIVIEN